MRRCGRLRREGTSKSNGELRSLIAQTRGTSAGLVTIGGLGCVDPGSWHARRASDAHRCWAACRVTPSRAAISAQL